MMKEVYEELDRPKEVPFRNWEDAIESIPFDWYGLAVSPIKTAKECFEMEKLFRKLLEFSSKVLELLEPELLEHGTKISIDTEQDSENFKYLEGSFDQVQKLIQTAFEK